MPEVTSPPGEHRMERGNAQQWWAILGAVSGADRAAPRPHRGGGTGSFPVQLSATDRPHRRRGADMLHSPGRVAAALAPTRPPTALTARSGSRSRRWGRRWPEPARTGRAGSWAGRARAAPTPRPGGCCCYYCCCCSAWRPRRPPPLGVGKRWRRPGGEGPQPPRSGRPPAAPATPAAAQPRAAAAPATPSRPASRPVQPRSAAGPRRRKCGRRKRKLFHSLSVSPHFFRGPPHFLFGWSVALGREWGATSNVTNLRQNRFCFLTSPLF